MNQSKIQSILTKQRSFFASGATKELSFRLHALSKLKNTILENESLISNALKKDLNKSEFESYMTEIGIVLEEISFFKKQLKKLMKPRRAKTPITQFPAKSVIYPEPFGNVLILSPWNYPFQLSMTPLVGAIAAGNCVILKPSNDSPHTSSAISLLLKQCFEDSFVSVITGGRTENAALLEQKFDYIFFTGGPVVGKLVLESAAKHYTPVTLELGGKSPCIVEKTANLETAAKRIVFGKLLAAGQTCVAPDYLLVQEEVKNSLIKLIKQNIKHCLGPNPITNPEYPKIINSKHFDRICSLISSETILYGGCSDRETLKIEPTLVEPTCRSAPIMQEEIFGPILPILTFREIDQVIDALSSSEKPLALYLFTKDKTVETQVLRSLSFGGGCINDTIVHLVSSSLPFGGVGESGMGSYHGEKSFDTFSHKKSILKKASWFDLPLRYHPYQKHNLKFIKKFMK